MKAGKNGPRGQSVLWMSDAWVYDTKGATPTFDDMAMGSLLEG